MFWKPPRLSAADPLWAGDVKKSGISSSLKIYYKIVKKSLRFGRKAPENQAVCDFALFLDSYPGLYHSALLQ